MKRFTYRTVFLSLMFLGFAWTELSVAASSCAADQTLHSIDSNGDGAVSMEDAVHLFFYLFKESEPPQVCLSQHPGPKIPDVPEISNSSRV